VTPIPDVFNFAGAAPLMCAGVSVCTGLRRAGIQLGQWDVISGAGGGLGHLAIQFANALGAKTLALDAGSKEKFCLDLGATAFVDFTTLGSDTDLAEHIRGITDDAVKIALVCSSSNRAAQAISLLGYRGVLSCMGVPEGKVVRDR